jgi:MraZ protein
MEFVGKFDYQLDDRNRVPIPPPYRAAFKDGGFVATGTGRHLVLHTPESFAQAAQVIEAQPEESDQGENVRRDFYANTWPIQPDGQGRVLLDKELILHAGLTKEIKIIGAGRRMEIWDRAAWDEAEPERKTARQAAVNPGSAPGPRGAVA